MNSNKDLIRLANQNNWYWALTAGEFPFRAINPVI